MTISGVLVDIGKATSSFAATLDANGSLISIEFDAVIEEAHDWQNTVTASPVEDGGNITDNLLRNPRKITLTGVVTNAPIFDSTSTGTFSNDSGAIDGSSQETRVNQVFGLLRNFMDKGLLTIVYTRYMVYFDMAILSINIPRKTGLGEALQFTIEFQEVRIVSTQNVTVPAGISAKTDKKIGTSVQTKTMPTKNDGAVSATNLNTSGAASITDAALKGVSGIVSGLKSILGLQ